MPDDAATVPFVNRRIKQLNAKRRETEKQLADERQQNALRQAQLEARLDTLTRVLVGAAPDVPASPPQPTGPPQAEQFESHEEFVLGGGRATRARPALSAAAPGGSPGRVSARSS